MRAKSVPGQIGMILALCAIAIVGYFVWAHHMFTTGMTDTARIYFSAATLVIGIPTAVKIFTWTCALSEICSRTPELAVVVAFVACFVAGGFTGLILANAGLDLCYHDSYFVVGHFHFVLSIAAAFGLMAFGCLYARLCFHGNLTALKFFHIFGLIVWAVNSLFLLQHFVGLVGHPRRIFFGPGNISRVRYFFKRGVRWNFNYIIYFPTNRTGWLWSTSTPDF